MFTGLIEKTAEVEFLKSPESGNPGMTVLRIRVRNFASSRGDSVAINGCCLTVTRSGKDFQEFEISRETLACTTLGGLKKGDRVNTERALKLGDRLGGHLVSGHVDETAIISSFDQNPQGRLLMLQMLPGSAALVIPKGSIAVNGVSLTINQVIDLSDGGFRISLMIIPETLGVTNLSDFLPGARVNIEYDQIGKFILRNSRLQHSGNRLRS